MNKFKINDTVEIRYGKVGTKYKVTEILTHETKAGKDIRYTIVPVDDDIGHEYRVFENELIPG